MSDYSDLFKNDTQTKTIFTAAAAVTDEAQALAFTNANIAYQQGIMRIPMPDDAARKGVLKNIYNFAWKYLATEGTDIEKCQKVIDLYSKANEAFPNDLPAITAEQAVEMRNNSARSL